MASRILECRRCHSAHIAVLAQFCVYGGSLAWRKNAPMAYNRLTRFYSNTGIWSSLSKSEIQTITHAQNACTLLPIGGIPACGYTQRPIWKDVRNMANQSSIYFVIGGAPSTNVTVSLSSSTSRQILVWPGRSRPTSWSQPRSRQNPLSKRCCSKLLAEEKSQRNLRYKSRSYEILCCRQVSN